MDGNVVELRAGLKNLASDFVRAYLMQDDRGCCGEDWLPYYLDDHELLQLHAERDRILKIRRPADLGALRALTGSAILASQLLELRYKFSRLEVEEAMYTLRAEGVAMPPTLSALLEVCREAQENLDVLMERIAELEEYAK